MEAENAVTFRFTEIIRALFILVSMSPLRKNTFRLFKILWASREIIGLFFLNWLFFTAIARVFFQSIENYKDGDGIYNYNYESFWDTFYTMYCLMVGANYPDAMVVHYAKERFLFLFYFSYSFVTIFIMMNIVTGILYFNYTKTVCKPIEDNLHDEEFVMVMKLCLKDGIVKSERVDDIISIYQTNPEMIKFKALLHNAKNGKIERLLQYTQAGRAENAEDMHVTDKIWWRIAFACVDMCIVFMCLFMVSYYD